MMNSDNGSNDDDDSLFSVRTLSFILIGVVIGFAIYFQKSRDDVRPAGDIHALEERHSEFIMRLIMVEALMLDYAGVERREDSVREIRSQLDTLVNQVGLRTLSVEVQKRVIQSYLETAPDDPPPDQAPLARDYRLVYVRGLGIPDDSPLLALPTGDLVRLKLMRMRGESEAADSLEGELKEQALKAYMKMLSGVLIVAGCMAASFLILIKLFVSPPLALYGPQLDLVPPGENRVLFETALLYLFLMFPLGGMIAGQIPAGYALLFHLAYLPLIMGISLFYFASNTSPGVLKLILFGEAPRLKLLLREIGYGFVGFLAVFPFAALVLGFFLTMLLYLGLHEGESALRFAHPVVFEIEKRPILIFVLAVLVVPLMEEIVFRGFLYGFFRKQAGVEVVEGSFGRVLLAGAGPGFLSGFFFAILHPQGWPAIPYLTLLGMGLGFVREVRATIIAPTVAHMCVNALAVVLSYWLLGLGAM